MKNYLKLLSLVLALLFVAASLLACGGDPVDTPEQTEPHTTEPPTSVNW